MAGTAFARAGNVEIVITGTATTANFTTSGGVLCASGWAEDNFQKFGGSGHSRAGSFHGYKVMHCDGSADTFSITYDAATVFGSPQDQGGWHLFDGTGAYAGCSGGGNLVGIYTDVGITDHYTGRVQCGS